MSALRPESYEERVKRARKRDQWRRESQRRYEERRRSEGKKHRSIGNNPERRKKRFKRQYHSEERVRFVRELGCTICGKSPADNAHVRTGGMGMKADYIWTAPLCRFHHVQYDMGRGAFKEEFGVDMEEVARETEEAWREREET